MYTEETERSIDWGGVLKKGVLIIIIALVIFLIIWLFARNNNTNANTNVNYDDGTNNGVITDNGNNTNNGGTTNVMDSKFYSSDFIDGFRYFHDTSKEYFLISELPESGKTLKYTLQELIDKNLVLPFGYNGSSCDSEASYVTVTNTNGKYNMTTTLVCGNEVAKTTEELGCNQLCIGGNCQVSIHEVEPEDLTLEYEFRQSYKETENVYVCPSGYTQTGSGKNTICQKGDQTSVPATKVVTYNCPSGYVKSVNGDKVSCTRSVSGAAKPIENVTYSCKSGYTPVGSGANMTCKKTTNENKNATVNYTYSCPSGTTSQTGSGASLKCYKTTTSTVNATPTCSSGTLQNGKCVTSSTSTKELGKNSSANYGCPSGYSYYSGSGSSLKCYRTSSKTYYTSYSSYKGKTYNGCTYSGPYTAPCGTGCVKTYHQYYCSSKSTNYANGVVTSYSYSCPSGTSYSTGSGSSLRCFQYVNSSSSSEPTYTCSNGKLNGTTCTIESKTELTVTKTAKYSCDTNNGWVLNSKDNKCYKTTNSTVSPDKNTSYKCPDGFKASGSGKDMKCTSTSFDSKNAIKNTQYKCASGYTKYGYGELSMCTKGSISTVSPTLQTKEVTKWRYKWSTEEYLAGWERTGKTRQIKASPVK